MPCSECLFSVDQDDHHATCKKDSFLELRDFLESVSRDDQQATCKKDTLPWCCQIFCCSPAQLWRHHTSPNSSSFAELIGCAGGCCSVSILMFHSTNTGLHSLALQWSVLLPLLPDQFLHQPIVRVMLITYPCTQPPTPPTAWFEPCCSSLLRWAMSSWVNHNVP